MAVSPWPCGMPGRGPDLFHAEDLSELSKVRRLLWAGAWTSII